MNMSLISGIGICIHPDYVARAARPEVEEKAAHLTEFRHYGCASLIEAWRPRVAAHERDQQLVSAEFLGLRKEVVAVLDRRCRLVERGIEIPLPSGEPRGFLSGGLVVCAMAGSANPAPISVAVAAVASFRASRRPMVVSCFALVFGSFFSVMMANSVAASRWWTQISELG
jgi:hypothetical protein